MPKTIQLHAPIAYYSLTVPTHCKMMSSDADDRPQPSGLVSVLADPHDAIANASLRAAAVFTLSPGAKKSHLVRWYVPPFTVGQVLSVVLLTFLVTTQIWNKCQAE